MVITKGLSQINSTTRWNVLTTLVWLQGPEENCLLTPDTLQSRTARQLAQKVLPAKTTIRQCLYRVWLFYVIFIFSNILWISNAKSLHHFGSDQAHLQISHSKALCEAFKLTYGDSKKRNLLISWSNFAFALWSSTARSKCWLVSSNKVFSNSANRGCTVFNSSNPLRPVKLEHRDYKLKIRLLFVRSTFFILMEQKTFIVWSF